MAEILEQDQINELIAAQNEIEQKKSLSSTAIQKLETIHESVTGTACTYNLTDWDQLGMYIGRIQDKITVNSYYYESFKMLRDSYIKRNKK